MRNVIGKLQQLVPLALAVVALGLAPAQMAFAQADLEVSGVGPDVVQPGETMDFTFTVTNHGPSPDPSVTFYVRPEFAYDSSTRFADPSTGDCTVVNPAEDGLNTLGLQLPPGAQAPCDGGVTDPAPWAFTPSQGSCHVTQEWCDCESTLWPALHVKCDLGVLTPNQEVTVDVSLPLSMDAPPEPALVFHQPAEQGTWELLSDDNLHGFRPANFSGSLYFGQPVTGDLMLANALGGADPPSWGCSQIWNGDYAGKIALIKRGSCEFGAKVVNAEIQGAAGAIVYNDSVYDDPTRGGYIWMAAGLAGGDATIPAVFIPLEAGQALEAALQAGTVNLTMGPTFPEPWEFDVLAFTYDETNDPDDANNAVSGAVQVGGEVTLAASFTFAPTNPVAGATVTFTDTSTGSPTTWAWSFGDGETTTEQNPTHAFAAAGAFTVTLTVSDGTVTDTASQTVTVSAVEPPPTAAFTFAPTNPAANETVTFTDTSTGVPTSWAWDFGDGGTSADQNPTHAFAADDTYTVTLTATNAQGSDSVSHDVTVGGAEPPLPELYYVAAAANSAGVGSFWVTDLEINNRGTEVMQYRFLWLPRNTDNSDPTESEIYTLGAGESARYENVLNQVFATDNAFGALAIAANSTDAIVMSRTFNQTADGTFGQAIGGLYSARLIQANDRMRVLFMSETDPADVPTTGYRANLGLLNGTDAALTVNVARYNNAGVMQGDALTVELDPWENTQLNRLLKDFAPVEGYVDVWTETAGGAFAAYGSVVDNMTSDPTTVMPE